MKLKDLYQELKSINDQMFAKKKGKEMLKDLENIKEGDYCDWATPIERRGLAPYLVPAFKEAIAKIGASIDALEIDATLIDLLSAPEVDD